MSFVKVRRAERGLDGAFVSWILDGRGLFEPTNRGFLSLGGWREKKLLGGVVWWQIC